MQAHKQYTIHTYSPLTGVGSKLATIRNDKPLNIVELHEKTNLLQDYLKELYGTLIILPC